MLRRNPTVCRAPMTLALITAGIAAPALPVLAVDWRFTEDFNALTTADLISVDGLQNPAKANALHTTASPAQTYEAQFGFGNAGGSADIVGGTLELTRDGNRGSEAFSVLSTGNEADAPTGIMAATSMKFRIDDAGTSTLGDGSGFHVSWYRNLIHNGTRDDGPWVNNLAAVGFRNIGGGTFDVWGDGYLSPFGSGPETLAYEAQLGTLNTDTWYTAEVYLPAFNANTSDEHVDAQYRILDETGTELLAYGAVQSHHLTRPIIFTDFSTENTPQVVGIQTINTQSMDAEWALDDLKIGVGTGADIDAVYSNLTTSAGSYYDYNFDGAVTADDAIHYVTQFLQTQVGDVDLDRDVDADDLAIAQANAGGSGGWDDGDLTGDGLVDAADLAIIQAILGPSGLAGDFNGNGSVEQADLDLVLGNWGLATTPAGFVANTDGLTDGVDQDELDAVLGNWGSSTAPSFNGLAVPEPATLAAVAGLGLLAMRRRTN